MHVNSSLDKKKLTSNMDRLDQTVSRTRARIAIDTRDAQVKKERILERLSSHPATADMDEYQKEQWVKLQLTQQKSKKEAALKMKGATRQIVRNVTVAHETLQRELVSVGAQVSAFSEASKKMQAVTNPIEESIKYISKHTTSHLPFLDPCGKAVAIYPSLTVPRADDVFAKRGKETSMRRSQLSPDLERERATVLKEDVDELNKRIDERAKEMQVKPGAKLEIPGLKASMSGKDLKPSKSNMIVLPVALSRSLSSVEEAKVKAEVPKRPSNPGDSKSEDPESDLNTEQKPELAPGQVLAPEQVQSQSVRPKAQLPLPRKPQTDAPKQTSQGKVFSGLGFSWANKDKCEVDAGSKEPQGKSSGPSNSSVTSDSRDTSKSSDTGSTLSGSSLVGVTEFFLGHDGKLDEVPETLTKTLILVNSAFSFNRLAVTGIVRGGFDTNKTWTCSASIDKEMRVAPGTNIRLTLTLKRQNISKDPKQGGDCTGETAGELGASGESGVSSVSDVPAVSGVSAIGHPVESLDLKASCDFRVSLSSATGTGHILILIKPARFSLEYAIVDQGTLRTCKIPKNQSGDTTSGPRLNFQWKSLMGDFAIGKTGKTEKTGQTQPSIVLDFGRLVEGESRTIGLLVRNTGPLFASGQLVEADPNKDHREDFDIRALDGSRKQMEAKPVENEKESGSEDGASAPASDPAIVADSTLTAPPVTFGLPSWVNEFDLSRNDISRFAFTLTGRHPVDEHLSVPDFRLGTVDVSGSIPLLKFSQSKSVSILARAQTLSYPISFTLKEQSVGCVVEGSTYRVHVEVRNSWSIPLKIHFKEIGFKGHGGKILDILPSSAVIQGASSLIVRATFEAPSIKSLLQASKPGTAASRGQSGMGNERADERADQSGQSNQTGQSDPVKPDEDLSEPIIGDEDPKETDDASEAAASEAPSVALPHIMAFARTILCTCTSGDTDEEAFEGQMALRLVSGQSAGASSHISGIVNKLSASCRLSGQVTMGSVSLAKPPKPPRKTPFKLPGNDDEIIKSVEPTATATGVSPGDDSKLPPSSDPSTSPLGTSSLLGTFSPVKFVIPVEVPENRYTTYSLVAKNETCYVALCRVIGINTSAVFVSARTRVGATPALGGALWDTVVLRKKDQVEGRDGNPMDPNSTKTDPGTNDLPASISYSSSDDGAELNLSLTIRSAVSQGYFLLPPLSERPIDLRLTGQSCGMRDPPAHVPELEYVLLDSSGKIVYCSSIVSQAVSIPVPFPRVNARLGVANTPEVFLGRLSHSNRLSGTVVVTNRSSKFPATYLLHPSLWSASSESMFTFKSNPAVAFLGPRQSASILITVERNRNGSVTQASPGQQASQGDNSAASQSTASQSAAHSETSIQWDPTGQFAVCKKTVIVFQPTFLPGEAKPDSGSEMNLLSMGPSKSKKDQGIAKSVDSFVVSWVMDRTGPARTSSDSLPAAGGLVRPNWYLATDIPTPDGSGSNVVDFGTIADMKPVIKRFKLILKSDSEAEQKTEPKSSSQSSDTADTDAILGSELSASAPPLSLTCPRPPVESLGFTLLSSVFLRTVSRTNSPVVTVKFDPEMALASRSFGRHGARFGESSGLSDPQMSSHYASFDIRASDGQTITINLKAAIDSAKTLAGSQSTGAGATTSQPAPSGELKSA